MIGLTPTIDRQDVRTLATIQGDILDRDAWKFRNVYESAGGPPSPDLTRAVGPQVGDYVDLGDGAETPRVRRIAHLWTFEDSEPTEWHWQPTGTLGDGSFHYSSHTGRASFSGGLDPGRPYTELTRHPDGELRPARGWIWHHGHQAAHNGVTVTLYVPVWRVNT